MYIIKYYVKTIIRTLCGQGRGVIDTVFRDPFSLSSSCLRPWRSQESDRRISPRIFPVRIGIIIPSGASLAIIVLFRISSGLSAMHVDVFYNLLYFYHRRLQITPNFISDSSASSYPCAIQATLAVPLGNGEFERNAPLLMKTYYRSVCKTVRGDDISFISTIENCWTSYKKKTKIIPHATSGI